MGRQLSVSDMKSILYLSDCLHFSDDLIDYLLQYCVDRGKKDFKYIEAVALNWAQSGVTTPKQAEKFAAKYDKSVYTIMKELGKNNTPTKKELEYIIRWTKEYGFSQDIIAIACERTVLATDSHRFEYAEGILSNWKKRMCITSPTSSALMPSTRRAARAEAPLPLLPLPRFLPTVSTSLPREATTTTNWKRDC